MISLQEFYEREATRDEVSAELAAHLRRFSGDLDFLTGILNLAKDRADRRALIDFIKAGEGVNEESLILTALWLSQRQKESGLDR